MSTKTLYKNNSYIVSVTSGYCPLTNLLFQFGRNPYIPCVNYYGCYISYRQYILQLGKYEKKKDFNLL